MRNLRNTHRWVLSSENTFKNGEEAPRHVTAVNWDVANDSVICTFGPSKNDVLIQLKRWSVPRVQEELVGGNPPVLLLEQIAAWDAPCPLPHLDCDRVLDLHYFTDSSTTCLVLAGGDIIVVRENTVDGEEKIEIVGSVDVGISAATWSPDEELLAITTRADTLLYMSRDFGNVANTLLTNDDLKSSKHVSVGWGKAETQFKGKGAKALRDPTVPEKVDEGIKSQKDDDTTTISWRGDGAYVAINSFQASVRRVIRIFSREGILDGVSEPVDALESALSWRPAGNLLASIQRLEEGIDVIFTERNGLRHGQFALRLDKQEMGIWGAAITLQWNVDSSVLAVCFPDRVQLWTMGNYHYYLKQVIRLSSSNISKRPAFFSWHPEHPLLFVTGNDASIQRLEYIATVTAGTNMPPLDNGTVAVIDGRTVKLTPLRLANLPPPMCAHEITVKSSVIDVAFSETDTASATTIAILDHFSLTVYEWDLGSKPLKPPVFVADLCLNKEVDSPVKAETPSFHQQIQVTSHHTIFLLSSTQSRSLIQRIELDSGILRCVELVHKQHLQGLLTLRSKFCSSIYLHTTEGHVVVGSNFGPPLNGSTGTPGPSITTFAKRTSKVELIDIDLNVPGSPHRSQTIAFGLTLNGSLFANGRSLARDCTSFLVTPVHLIFTTTQHLLKFVHLDSLEDLEVPPNIPEADERCRSVERGAKLITVIPSISALVMQMPRGNLETIYPRALVLAGIRQSINNYKYKKAFLACRNHRVDMNILHDHAPSQFISSAGLFVDQVRKVEHIDLFLSQLREEDVSKTMYKETIRPKALNNSPFSVDVPIAEDIKITASKVNRICDALLEVLQRRTATNLQNIITSHVCKIPPDLDAGLLHVAKLQKSSPEQAEAAVEHICFLADANRLFDNALGLYDLELVVLVAQQSQKDPREYLPFLQKLQELPTLRRQYEIDDHLGRYSKALKHLRDMNDFEEFKAYMAKHNLYDDALLMFRYQENNIKEIMRLYADYLQSESKYKDAGIAYEYLKDYESAYESYRLAHLWKESLSCACFVPLDDVQLQSLAKSIADSLIELKDYYSAALIHFDYLHDVESGARLFCRGYFFADAIRVLSLHRRAESLESVVDNGLVEGMATMTELLAECKAQLNAQTQRLRELRIKKAEEPMAFYDGDVNGGADIPDNVSLAPTDTSTVGGSLFTRYTNRTGTVGTNATRRTSKNRRREERKRARGKKGSVYEEEYLVNSIGRLIDRVNAVGDEVARLVMGLMRRGMTERAKAVESAMVDVVALCKGCVTEVFQPETKAETVEGGDVENPERPTDGEGLVGDNMEEAQTRKEAPVIKDFGRLALLGR